MKRKYRIISILLITLMVFSSMTVSSFAASKPYVYVCTYQNYAQAQEVLKLIKAGMSKADAEAKLIEIGEKVAE